MSGSCKKANDKNSKLHLKTTLLKVDFYQNDFILPLLLYRNKILFYFIVIQSSLRASLTETLAEFSQLIRQNG